MEHSECKLLLLIIISHPFLHLLKLLDIDFRETQTLFLYYIIGLHNIELSYESTVSSIAGMNRLENKHDLWCGCIVQLADGLTREEFLNHEHPAVIGVNYLAFTKGVEE